MARRISHRLPDFHRDAAVLAGPGRTARREPLDPAAVRVRGDERFTDALGLIVVHLSVARVDRGTLARALSVSGVFERLADTGAVRGHDAVDLFFREGAAHLIPPRVCGG
ncbi:MAG: hypothetical protein LC808_00535 [Actinobacteria bacterium]|nr:hypothetical protein [Actinomycetota bacterium]